MRIIKIFLMLTTTFLVFVNCSNKQNPCNFVVNPDVSCRICDEKNGRTKLIEYFNADSNDLRLFLITSEQSVEIEHPYGKIDNFKNKVDSNQLLFDLANPQNLIVNGQKFVIVKKE